jgi:hypothetical protein
MVIYWFPQNLTFAQDDIINLISHGFLSRFKPPCRDGRYARCGPLPRIRHKIRFMARFTIDCGNNPSQTSWGSVKKKGRFMREIAGCGQTSGSVRNCYLTVNNPADNFCLDIDIYLFKFISNHEILLTIR